MKKITLVAAVAALAFGFTSCKKDHTCTCTTTDTYGGTTYTTVTTIKAKTTKKDGTAWCSAVPSATTTENGAAVTGGTTPTCVLN